MSLFCHRLFSSCSLWSLLFCANKKIICMALEFNTLPSGTYLIVSRLSGLAMAYDPPTPESNTAAYAISFKYPNPKDNSLWWKVIQVKGSSSFLISSYNNPQRLLSTQLEDQYGNGHLLIRHAEGDYFSAAKADGGFFYLASDEVNGSVLNDSLRYNPLGGSSNNLHWAFVSPDLYGVSLPGAPTPAPGDTLAELKQQSLRHLFDLDDSRLRQMIPDQFRLMMKNSPSVKSQFFNSAPQGIKPLDGDMVDNMAVAWVCEAIAHSTIKNFKDIIDKNRVDNYVKSPEGSDKRRKEGQHIYQSFFALYCTDSTGNIRFKQYLDDHSINWEAELFHYLTSPSFILNELAKKKTEPHWLDLLNLTIFKYKQFNPSPARVEEVIKAWRHHLSDPTIADTWGNSDFVPWDDFVTDQDIMGIVSAEAGVRTAVDGKGNKVTDAGGSVNLGIVKFNNYATGLDLRDWIINGKSKSLGFWNNQYPNIFDHPISSPVVEVLKEGAEALGTAQGRVDKARWEAQAHPFGCFVAGTPILLKDGASTAVDRLTPGQALLSKDGHTTYTGEEKIAMVTDVPVYLFGIDDGVRKDVPFFSGGHLFYTPEGWKAISPETAIQENPHIKVGALRPGDSVFRAKSSSPFSYELVDIKDFTVDVLPAGSNLYSVHLVDGLQYYHANGYLVSANYPQMSEWRLRHNFSKLSDKERAFLLKHVNEMLPLLQHAIGPFITVPLLRALHQTEQP